MNVQEFRKDLSKHLNEAVQGKPVFFVRAGQMFKLEAFKPITSEPYIYKVSSKPDETNIIKKVKLCKHGNPKGL